MKTLEQLLASHCRPLTTGALPPADVQAQMQVLPEWRLDAGAVVRTYRFADYHETIAFVNALAWVAHGQDHHPDLVVSYNRCEVRFTTHSVGGISDNDFICAARADALYAERAAPPAA